MMGTDIFKIHAEMAAKIEVEDGNPHLETDRKAYQLQHQFSLPFRHQFSESLCT